MCLNPILRPNVKYRNRFLAYSYGKDPDSAYIYVPCGHCPECVAAKQNSLVQRIQMESKYNHMFFCTLTYDNEHLPVFELEVPVKRRADETLIGLEPQHVITPEEAESFLEDAGFDSGELDVIHSEEDWDPDLYEDGVETMRFPYADIHHIQLLLKNLRDNNPCDGRNLRYVAVSELGKTNGRPHFHILFLVEKRPDDEAILPAVYLKGLPARKGVKPEVYTKLESALYHAVFKYWAINVGTRKNPVYEPLFKYRKRYYGGKVYTNFDLHYVNPDLTTEGVSNVAYYVTKYIMKGSEKEARRQQFLRLNLSEEDYNLAWKTIRCRCLMSKGLGLDARMYTEEEEVPVRNPNFKCDEYAEYLNVLDGDDLPPDDLPEPAAPTVIAVRKKRIMVPNFELAGIIRKNLTRDVGTSPGPVFISPDGKHRPLSHYYQTKGYIYCAYDFFNIIYNAPEEVAPHRDWTKQEKDRAMYKHQKRLQRMRANSMFDTSPALLWGSDQIDNNCNLCYGD